MCVCVCAGDIWSVVPPPGNIANDDWQLPLVSTPPYSFFPLSSPVILACLLLCLVEPSESGACLEEYGILAYCGRAEQKKTEKGTSPISYLKGCLIVMGITTQPVTVEYYLPWLRRSFVDDATAVLCMVRHYDILKENLKTLETGNVEFKR